jgi:4-amino-4-deoxy-L-arabinose transferase-like glycosyltransferase
LVSTARGRAVAALLVVALAGFLSFYRLGETPLVDPDEGRYAVGAAGMLATGDWIVPRFNGEPRLNKPPLAYWLQAVAMAGVGRGETAVRLPAAAAGLVVVVALLAAGWRRRVPDGVMAGFLCLALLAMLEIHEGRLAMWPGSLLAATALGLAALAKGHVPVAVFLVIEAAYLLLRRGRSRPALGPLAASAALVVVLFLPWALGVVSRVGWGPLGEAVTHEVERLADGAEHPEPWHYYLLRYPLVLLPWTGFLLSAAARAWRRRTEPAVAFALAWSLAPIVLFSVIRGKNNLYLLPALPGAALLVGLAWTGRSSGAALAERRRLMPVALVTAVLFVSGTAFLLGHHSSRDFFADHRAAAIATTAALVVVVVALAWWRRGAVLAGVLALFMSGLLVTALSVGPHVIGHGRSTKVLAEAYRAEEREGDDILFYRGSADKHASLLFYLDRPVATAWRSRTLRARRREPGRLFMVCGDDDYARLSGDEIARWEGPLASTRELALYREIGPPALGIGLREDVRE